jgi:hypothetical protein
MEPTDQLARAAFFREKAAECRKQGAGVSSQEAKETYENMARSYDTLSDGAERLHQIRSGQSVG